MSKMSRKVRMLGTTTKVTSNRRNIHKYGLGAGLGIAFGFTAGDAASAHNCAFVPATFTPVTHNHAGATSPLTNWHQSSSGKSILHTSLTPSPTTDNLNLSGTSASYSAGLLGSFKTITIDVGGTADVVKMSSKLTDAELVAADQVLSGGSQTLTLNARGAAAGGALNLNSSLLTSLDNALGGSVNSITIPKHVTLDDSVSSLNLTGNLVNFGSLVSQSGTAGGNTINAASISNAGNISAAKSDLTLNAATINNTGTITSGTNLNLGSGVINNVGGTMSAGQAINVNNPGGISITGGNMLSQTLNLNAGSSALNVNGANITGVVNDTAGSAHINATSQNFILGNSNVSGDPLFSTTGNFTISGNVSPTGGAALAIIAGGNITSGTGAALDTSSTVGNGGALTLVAGANFSINPANGDLTIIQSNLPNGGSATGGTINLAGTAKGGAPITRIDTSSTAGNGGNVIMVAYAGSGAGSGTVTVPTGVTIDTSSTGGNGGGVMVVAGAAKGISISLGNINASASAGNAGQITLDTSTPLVTNGGLVITPAGKIIGGINIGPSAPLAVLPASVLISSIQDNGVGAGGVQILTGSTVTFTNIDTSGVGGAAGTAGAGGAGGGNGGNVSILAQGSITGNNLLTFGGGGGGGGGGSMAAQKGGAGGGGGNAGTITLETFTGNITLNGEANASGGSGGGGGGGFSNGGKGTTAGGGGGAAGTAANIVLSTEGQNTNGAFANPTKSGTVSVLQGIFAIDGVAGGKGGTGDAAGVANAGSGGGGGGSYGGGGGGGGGGVSTTVGLNGSGGGGGGGFWGGGGGDNGATTNGASGGGAGTPGSNPNGNEGTQLSGASGTGNPNSGGSIGTGGLAGTLPVTAVVAANGNSVNAATTGNAVFITTNSGIGTTKAAQFIFAPTVTLDAVAGSVFANFGGNTVVTGVQSALGGTISLAANGNLTTGLVSKTGQLILTTLPWSNGNISMPSDIVATKSLIATASGTGTITQAKATDFISTPLMVATSESGNINLIGGNTIGGFQFNTQGNVNLTNNIAMNVLASAASGAGSTVTITDNNSPININGNVLVQAGTATFNAGTNIKIAAQVTAPGGDTFVAGNGTITVGATLVNPGPITFTSDFASLGSVMINAPQVTITANGAKVTDLYTNAHFHHNGGSTVWSGDNLQILPPVLSHSAAPAPD